MKMSLANHCQYRRWELLTDEYILVPLIQAAKEESALMGNLVLANRFELILFYHSCPAFWHELAQILST